MQKYQLYTTMGAGFESVVAKELQSLGYQTRTENGRVFFKGDHLLNSFQLKLRLHTR